MLFYKHIIAKTLASAAITQLMGYHNISRPPSPRKVRRKKTTTEDANKITLITRHAVNTIAK